MSGCLFPIAGYSIYTYDGGCANLPLVEGLLFRCGAAKIKTAGGKDSVEDDLAKVMHFFLQSGSSANSKSYKNILKRVASYKAANVVLEIISNLHVSSLSSADKHLSLRLLGRVIENVMEPTHIVKPVLTTVKPLLFEDDFYIRMEAREVVCVLSKCAGIVPMISFLRNDVSHNDPAIRELTAKTFALVGKTLGVSYVLPFIYTICSSRKCWEVRHSGALIIRYLATEMRFGILPFLYKLVSYIRDGLVSQERNVRITTATSIAHLAKASYPYGNSALMPLLPELWNGIKIYRGNGLAAYLNGLWCVLRVVRPSLVEKYSLNLLPLLQLNFKSSHTGVKMHVLKNLQICIKKCRRKNLKFTQTFLNDFFKDFWTKKVMAESESREEVSTTTMILSKSIDDIAIFKLIYPLLNDRSAVVRNSALRCIGNLLENSKNITEIILHYHNSLITTSMYVFEEHDTIDGKDMIFITRSIKQIFVAIGKKSKQYLPVVYQTLAKRLRNDDSKQRKQACDLLALLTPFFSEQGEGSLLGKIGLLLYENLGEGYPDTLSSVLNAMTNIIRVIKIGNSQISIDAVLRSVVPILRNRHEKVQMNCILLLGSIAKDHAICVPPREWMRICIEMTELLKAGRKNIRRAAVESFGLVARAIGPQDVTYTLLQNLRAQERQNRVCTTVAIAIVAEACGCFAVLPGLLNEFRVPDNNVQNGVLKALSFVFEYISNDGINYVNSISSLLVDSLTNRDTVHRQISATLIKHLSLDVEGCGHNTLLVHFMNYIWPNLYEQSPHVFFAAKEAVNGLLVSIGAGYIFNYCLLGLFHPARRVRDSHWDMLNTCLKYREAQLHAYCTCKLDGGQDKYALVFL
jgi:splicing factor 3B subunit 1